jgi:hypothetical protein
VLINSARKLRAEFVKRTLKISITSARKKLPPIEAQREADILVPSAINCLVNWQVTLQGDSLNPSIVNMGGETPQG